MENCTFDGKEICTFDLKDRHHYYINDLVEAWKIAAGSGKLRCSECGERVYLAAGPLKEPYFAHYDKMACTYGSQTESDELMKGKRLLYSLLKRSFPDCEIRARYKMNNGMYSSCYVANTNGKDIAIDYRLEYNSIEKFMERDRYCKDSDIIPVYVLGNHKNNQVNQISWYDNLVQKSMGISIYFDAHNEKLLLKKSFDYSIRGQRIVRYFSKSYPLSDVTMNHEGVFVCGFQDECREIEQQINAQIQQYNQDIRPDILQNALERLKRGEHHLISKKYLDYIRDNKLF